MTPEEIARREIDAQLSCCGWIVQDYRRMNISAGPGVAIREFPLSTGEADYLLYLDAKAVGVVEAKPEGHSLTVNIAHLGAGRFAEVEFPLPPMEEQLAIAAEVDRHLSLAAAAENAIDHGLRRAANLRQSILKQAFEGKLVPQDASDEPATVLLERLRNDRLPAETNNGKSRARRAAIKGH